MVIFGSRTSVAVNSHLCIAVDKSEFAPAGYRLASRSSSTVWGSEYQNGRKRALVRISGCTTYRIAGNMRRKTSKIPSAFLWPLLLGVSFTTTQGTCGVNRFTDLHGLQNCELKCMWRSALHVSRYLVAGRVSVAGKRRRARIRCLFGLIAIKQHMCSSCQQIFPPLLLLLRSSLM
jgi:hypothetical protein